MPPPMRGSAVPPSKDEPIVSITAVKTLAQMTGRDEFRFLADLVLKRSSADQTVVNLCDQHSGTTRFASSRIIQMSIRGGGTLTVTVAFDGHRGSASTTDFSTGSVQDALARAERIARVSRGSEYLPPRIRKSFRRSKRAGRRRPRRVLRRLEYANEAIGQCRIENLEAAGIVSSSVASVGVAASNGLFAQEEAYGGAFQSHRASGRCHRLERGGSPLDRSLRIQDRTLTAINKASEAGTFKNCPRSVPGHLGAGRGGGTVELDTLDAGRQIL